MYHRILHYKECNSVFLGIFIVYSNFTYFITIKRYHIPIVSSQLLTTLQSRWIYLFIIILLSCLQLYIFLNSLSFYHYKTCFISNNNLCLMSIFCDITIATSFFFWLLFSYCVFPKLYFQLVCPFETNLCLCKQHMAE